MAGIVYLVGAGPGDPGLITVRGADCLSRAEVVIADRLASPRLLERLPPDCERIIRGPNRSDLDQDEINRILVARAQAGKIVVRLKGGDPLLFGRGGEEAEALRKASIAFEIIPGVTAATAVPAYAGIPLTQRGIAAAVAFATAHENEAKPTGHVPWQTFSSPGTTVVLYMSVTHLDEAMSKLLAAGRSKDTPVAVISDGTSAAQRTIVGAIGDIVEKVRFAKLKPPALTVVGEVVRLRDSLAWFERRPLHGANVLVTRARGQADPTVARFESLGANVIAAPAIEIVPPESYDELDSAIMGFAGYRLVAFTSANAVDALFSRLKEHGLDARALAGKVVAAIGQRSEAALASRGIYADVVARAEGEATAEGLGKELAHRKFTGPALLPRAAEGRETLVEMLRADGVEVAAPPAYRTVPVNPSELQWVGDLIADQKIDAITFGSPRTVAALLAVVSDRRQLENVVVGAIGPTTAAALTSAKVHVDVVPQNHTFDALAEALVSPIRNRVAQRTVILPNRV